MSLSIPFHDPSLELPAGSAARVSGAFNFILSELKESDKQLLDAPDVEQALDSYWSHLSSSDDRRVWAMNKYGLEEALAKEARKTQRGDSSSMPVRPGPGSFVRALFIQQQRQPVQAIPTMVAQPATLSTTPAVIVSPSSPPVSGPELRLLGFCLGYISAHGITRSYLWNVARMRLLGGALAKATLVYNTKVVTDKIMALAPIQGQQLTIWDMPQERQGNSSSSEEMQRLEMFCSGYRAGSGFTPKSHWTSSRRLQLGRALQVVRLPFTINAAINGVREEQEQKVEEHDASVEVNTVSEEEEEDDRGEEKYAMDVDTSQPLPGQPASDNDDCPTLVELPAEQQQIDVSGSSPEDHDASPLQPAESVQQVQEDAAPSEVVSSHVNVIPAQVQQVAVLPEVKEKWLERSIHEAEYWMAHAQEREKEKNRHLWEEWNLPELLVPRVKTALLSWWTTAKSSNDESAHRAAENLFYQAYKEEAQLRKLRIHEKEYDHDASSLLHADSQVVSPAEKEEKEKATVGVIPPQDQHVIFSRTHVPSTTSLIQLPPVNSVERIKAAWRVIEASCSVEENELYKTEDVHNAMMDYWEVLIRSNDATVWDHHLDLLEEALEEERERRLFMQCNAQPAVNDAYWEALKRHPDPAVWDHYQGLLDQAVQRERDRRRAPPAAAEHIASLAPVCPEEKEEEREPVASAPAPLTDASSALGAEVEAPAQMEVSGPAEDAERLEEKEDEPEVVASPPPVTDAVVFVASSDPPAKMEEEEEEDEHRFIRKIVAEWGIKRGYRWTSRRLQLLEVAAASFDAPLLDLTSALKDKIMQYVKEL